MIRAQAELVKRTVPKKIGSGAFFDETICPDYSIGTIQLCLSGSEPH